MGGNTYNRKNFSDVELEQLITKISGLHSLFDDRTFESEKAWRANISRYLDADSSNRFYFKIEQLKGLPNCVNCSTTLGIDSFKYSGESKGFRRYCPECTQKESWKFSKNYNPDVLKDRGKKISKSKFEFYQSDKGKETAKSNGKKISVSLKKFFVTDKGKLARKKSAEYNSALMKERILTGTFTPNSNNRNTHWVSKFNGKTYRSSWEALYQYFNPYAEYETLRLPYTHNKLNLIYIVDFIDHDKRIVTEVKPLEMLNDSKTKSKILALTNWARQNNYSVEIFNLASIKKLDEPDYSLFDKLTTKKIKKIYENFKN